MTREVWVVELRMLNGEWTLDPNCPPQLRRDFAEAILAARLHEDAEGTYRLMRYLPEIGPGLVLGVWQDDSVRRP